MTLPVIQIVIGMGLGLLGFLWVRKRALTYQGNNYTYEHNREYSQPNSRQPNSSQPYSTPGDDCVVCLVEMTAEDSMHYFICGHAVHKDCFERCKHYGGSCCPICRHRI